MKERGFHVCITTYETVALETAALRKIEWDVLVVDEAHRLKNESSRLATVLRQVGLLAPSFARKGR